MEILSTICETIDTCKENALNSFDYEDSEFWLERAKEWEDKIKKMEVAQANAQQPSITNDNKIISQKRWDINIFNLNNKFNYQNLSTLQLKELIDWAENREFIIKMEDYLTEDDYQAMREYRNVYETAEKELKRREEK